MSHTEEKSLSRRGAQSAESPMRVDMDVYFEAVQNRFDNTKNPDGTFPMNVAENSLCWPLLKDKIASIDQTKIPEWVSSYGNPAGVESFRESVAHYLSKHLFKVPVEMETLAFSSGLTSVVDQTSFILGNPGDVVMIPAPAYPVYTSDISVKAGLRRYDIQTHREMDELKNGHPLSIEDLNRSLGEIRSVGETCRMLILTTPDNPTGAIYSREQLNSFSDWCIENEIHLVINEIYGLSLIDTNHPDVASDYGKTVEYLSFASIMMERRSPYLHLWYSFSKDLGISGFRIGLIHTYNEGLLHAYTNINMTHAISNYTQWIMQEVLSDDDFMSDYIRQNQNAVSKSYRIVTNSLKKIAIKHSPAYGSLFVWIDFEELLQEKTLDGERELWMAVYNQTGILLTPTEGFGHGKKGCYRMVTTYVSHSELEVAMEKLSSFVLRRRETMG